MSKNKEDKSKYFASWKTTEFIKTKFDDYFYFVSVAASALATIWFFSQKNIIASLTFFILAVIVVFQAVRKPREIKGKIDLRGITLNDRLYAYDEIDSFEVVLEENQNKLKFQLKRSILPSKEILLGDENPHYIRAVLDHFLSEAKQDEAVFKLENKNKLSDDMSEKEFFDYINKK